MTDPTSSKNPTSLRTALKHIAQNAEKYLMYAFYIYILFIVIAEVIRRYALGAPSLWGGETARYSFIYLTYIGMSWATYKRSHIRIDMIYGFVSEKIENYLYLFSDIITLIFAIYTIRYTIPIIQTSLRFGSATQALRVNRAFFQSAIIVGFSLLAIRVLQRMYFDIQDIRHNRPVYKGENVFSGEKL